ncbi:Putative ribonuclease H protein At1g65750 [Linum perenne]
MRQTTNLGRYLEIPVLHGRATSSRFNYILERIDKKLTSMKAKTLSLAGRVTLATSVLSSIYVYAMQTVKLPSKTCELIDIRIRDFVWGSQQGNRKIHLVNWDSVCLPKQFGGLWLRKAREMSDAFMMKVSWNLLKNPKELWAQVMISKYLKRSNGVLVARGTKHFSLLWRGVHDAWEPMNRGMH